MHNLQTYIHGVKSIDTLIYEYNYTINRPRRKQSEEMVPSNVNNFSYRTK